MLHYLRKIARFWLFLPILVLACAGSAVYTFLVLEYQYFPSKQILELMAFVEGGEADETTLVEKVENDLGLRPSRFIIDATVDSEERFHSIKLKNKNKRRLDPIAYSTKRAMPGYRVISGAFDFDGALGGAVLLDEANQIIGTYKFGNEDIQDKYMELKKAGKVFRNLSSDKVRLPHGMDLLPDGSLVAIDGTQDNSNSIRRKGICGKLHWARFENYHHSVHYDATTDSIWALGPPLARATHPHKIYDGGASMINQIGAENGDLMRKIDIWQIMKANHEYGVFSLRRVLVVPRKNMWMGDALHANDVEPLSASMADAFPMFEAGDLLYSLRSLNTVMVLDPRTLKMKWWRTGATRRQHDPDWNPDGTITVYDNQMRDREISPNAYSKIVRFDSERQEPSVIVDGAAYNFYSYKMGKHQVLPNGNVLITIPTKGRIIEVAPDGEVVFDFHNLFAGGENLYVSEAKWFDPSFFTVDIEEKAKCRPVVSQRLLR